MKGYSSRKIIQILTQDGWYKVSTEGDHHHFKHPTKKGKVTVTHPKKDMPLKTIKSIFNLAGIKLQ